MYSRSTSKNDRFLRLNPALWAVFCVGFTFFSLGCVETRVVSTRWDNLRKIADPKPDPDAKANARRRARAQAYGIQLETFVGKNRSKQAFEFADTVRDQAQIADIYFVERGNATVVYTGRYPREDHPEAVAQLRKVKQAKIDDKRVFAQAQIAPIVGGQSTRDQNDLRGYSGYRTLVVEVFEPDYGEDFRRAAENAADKLRREHNIGVYYYHGPYESLVTAGLFTLRDFVPVNGIDTYGPAIRQLQELFPHKKRNGKLLLSQNPETVGEPEKTGIVRVR